MVSCHEMMVSWHEMTISWHEMTILVDGWRMVAPGNLLNVCSLTEKVDYFESYL